MDGGKWRMERVIEKGIIQNNGIRLFEEIDRRGNKTVKDELLLFTPFTPKPDSLQNWIRQKKKYN
ncbi:MAG: hypothetical protein J0I41_23575 [Filimonas sp.]|nr:hypothetical protein [Filimonas sp.]